MHYKTVILYFNYKNNICKVENLNEGCDSYYKGHAYSPFPLILQKKLCTCLNTCKHLQCKSTFSKAPETDLLCIKRFEEKVCYTMEKNLPKCLSVNLKNNI